MFDHYSYLMDLQARIDEAFDTRDAAISQMEKAAAAGLECRTLSVLVEQIDTRINLMREHEQTLIRYRRGERRRESVRRATAEQARRL